jgi:hypothetical protein
MWPRRTSVALLVGLLAIPGRALAHGAGGRYELAIPQWLFLVGGGATVAVSFLVVSLVTGSDDRAFSYRSRSLSATPLRVLHAPALVAVVRTLAVVLLVLGIAAGAFGPRSFNENLLTNLVWVGWWIGYTFSVILVGNTWPILNPWRTVYLWVVPEAKHSRSRVYPQTLGHWPAVAVFLVFAWLELIAPISQSPRWMAVLGVAYSVYLWVGMALFGVDNWLTAADPFTVLYDYLGRFAPLSIRGEGELRSYGVGLVDRHDALWRPGALLLLVTVLYTVTFDGFLGTPEWAAIARSVPALPVPYATSTLLMVAGLLFFYESYGLVAWLMTILVGSADDEGYLARRFALSLLPVALAYQVSHFFTYLLTQGQYLLLALADPFGRGWIPAGVTFDPSGTIPFLSVGAVWQIQVGVIVLGHVIAVWVAHHVALDVFDGRWQAIRSQLPMTGAMVIYTVVGLLILTRTTVDPPLP